MSSASSDAIATVLGAALPGILFAGAGALTLAWSRKQCRDADTFENLVVQPIGAVLQRARSAADGDAGIAAVRGQVWLDQPDSGIIVPGVPEAVAAVSDSYWLRKMKIVEGKLRESNDFAGETKAAVPWHLQDTSGAVAVIDSSYKQLPLTPGPKFHEPVTDSGHLELWASRSGLSIKNSADRERVIGIERVPKVLKVGTLLTLVGRATLDNRGVLSFSARGSGPAALTADTLSSVIDAARAAGASTQIMGWVLVAIGATITAGGAVAALLQYLDAKDRVDSNRRPTTNEYT